MKAPAINGRASLGSSIPRSKAMSPAKRPAAIHSNPPTRQRATHPHFVEDGERISASPRVISIDQRRAPACCSKERTRSCLERVDRREARPQTCDSADSANPTRPLTWIALLRASPRRAPMALLREESRRGDRSWVVARERSASAPLGDQRALLGRRSSRPPFPSPEHER